MFIFAHNEAVISKPEVNKLLRNQSNYMYVVAVEEAHCILDKGHAFFPRLHNRKAWEPGYKKTNPVKVTVFRISMCFFSLTIINTVISLFGYNSVQDVI